MGKKKLLAVIIVGLLSAFCISVCKADNTYASCSNADGKITATGGFSSLGGTGSGDQGVSWACSSTNERGIMYLHTGISESGGNYSINTSVNLTEGTNGSAYLAGLIHSDKKKRNKNVWAAYIGFCIKKSDCNGKSGSGTNSINWNAVGGTAGGIISGVPSAVQRSFYNTNYPDSSYGYWTRPTNGAGITINTNTLISKICNDSNLTQSGNLKDSCGKTSGSYSGTVTLYIHRCWSESYSNGSYGMSSDDTCASSSVHLNLSITRYTPPVISNFDGSVTASFGTCTSDTCWTDNANNKVKFTHKMKRANDGASGNVSNNWYIFYGKTKDDSLSPNGNDHGSKSLAKNASLTEVKSHEADANGIEPGKEKKVCEALGFYKQVKDGSIDTSSTFEKRSDCMTIKRYADYTFTGSVAVKSVTGATYNSTTKKYYIDADKVSVTFDHTVKRTDSADDAEIGNNWQVWDGKEKADVSSATSPTPSYKDTVKLKKTKSSVVKTSGPSNVSLTMGKDKKICNTLGFYKTVYHTGTMHEWDKAEGCVTIHRYDWYTYTGQVVAATTDAVKKTLSDGYYWVDADTAPLKFTHQLKSSSTAKKTKFKTTKPSTPATSSDFGTQDSYVESTAFAKVDTYYDQKNSPSDTKPVNVPKDTGAEYCQTLYYYTKVREDLDWSNSATYGSTTSTSGCMKFKRYKTTFTGSSKVYVKVDGSYVDYTTKTTPYTATGTTYPVEVEVKFSHTVTRNNDTHGSPAARASHIKTTLNNSGVRQNDPEGQVIDVDTKGLKVDTTNPKDKYDTKDDIIKLKVYPEQTIKLCQKMTYRSEIQGTYNATADADEVCVTVKLGVAKCLSQEFGIKNAKNYLRGTISKNDESVVSDVLSTGSNKIETWAKPGDQVQFKYEGCAGGEIARQYAFSTTETSYNISTDVSGNLFGRTVGLKEEDKDQPGNKKYTATSSSISSASSNPGTGPFGGSYETVVTSPSGDTDTDRLYSCDAHGTDGMNNVYRIPAYINGLTDSSYRNKCNSEDVGRLSDLGETITQTASWTDLWYSGGSVVSDHAGTTTASLTADIHVPYNYKTTVTTGGGGGYMNPGSEQTESIKLRVEQRKNQTVNGESEYVTDSKTTKYQLIEIVIDSNYGGMSAADFADLVDKDEYYPDTSGSLSLAGSLQVCNSSTRNKTGGGYYYTCNTVVSDTSGKKYKKNETHTVVTHKITIPDNVVAGTKYCYIAAVWPSDSHKPIGPNNKGKYVLDPDLNVDDNAAGLVDTGYFWHVSGVTCYTISKRPSISVLGGDSYAQKYISARIQKRSTDSNDANSRIYGSWTEYAAVAGSSIKGYASGATLWGGSDITSDSTVKKTCAFSSYTFANKKCSGSGLNPGELGTADINTTSSSNPENIADQIKTRYTRVGIGRVTPTGDNTRVRNTGDCTLVQKSNDSYEYTKSGVDEDYFECIGDAGAKYTHIVNSGARTAYIYSGSSSPICIDKGSEESNHISIVHSDGTLVVGSNIVYGSNNQQYTDEAKENGCYPDVYSELRELPQSILIAKKIVIRHDVTHIDSWLIADEIITCDPESNWNGDVTISQINSKNCNQQLTINGPVMARDIKLFRTYGADYDGSDNHSASPAEVFNMGSETLLWAANQAQRYSQATTTYARELAPRY